MDNTKRKGAISVNDHLHLLGTVDCFLEPACRGKFRLCTGPESSLVHAFMLGYLAVTGRWGRYQTGICRQKTMICCMVSGVLVCVNWGVYIFAINSGHVLDASLGYFLEPIFVTAIGVFLFHEKMSRLEQMTALFSIIGVGYLMGVYRMVR